LLWGVALGRECCSEEKICSGELLWGGNVALGSCSGEKFTLGRNLLWGAREMLGGGKIKLPQSKLGL